MESEFTVVNLFNEISPFELANLETEIHEWIHVYMQENISKLPRPDFMDILVDELMEEFFIPYVESQLDDDSIDIDYDEFEYMVSFFIQNYFKIGYPGAMPPRYSLKHWKQKKTSNEIQEIQQKIEWVSNAPQPTQRTPEWYSMRYNLITASNIWKAVGTPANKNSIIYEKCKPFLMSDTEKVNVLSATHWGVRYEPVTVMLYEKLFNTHVGEFGCIQHPTYPFIGASPDGINIDVNSPKYGTMLEIKNIVNREIDGNPKLEYWIQTQVQMEVCNLEDCDFVETQFKEYEDGQDDLFYSEKDSHLWNGVILYFIERGFTNDRPHYVYMPIDMELTKDCVDLWITEQKDILANKYVLFRRIYWYCEVFSCVNVRRNRDWFQFVLPEIESVWRIIEHERQHGYEHRKPNTKISAVKTKPILQSLIDDFKEPTENFELDISVRLTQNTPIESIHSRAPQSQLKDTVEKKTVLTTTVDDTNFFEGDILRI